MLNVFSYSLDAFSLSPLSASSISLTPIPHPRLLSAAFGNRDRIEGSPYLSLIPSLPPRRRLVFEEERGLDYQRLAVEGHLADKDEIKKNRTGEMMMMIIIIFIGTRVCVCVCCVEWGTIDKEYRSIYLSHVTRRLRDIGKIRCSGERS